MGTDVRMLTAYGDDMNGERVAASCSELGIDLSSALRITGATTSTYLYLTDERGEMALAVSDMEICNQITPQYLASNLNVLQNAQVVIADTNIPAESLRYLAENCTAPLFIDPVSTTKAEKLRPILHRIHTLKPNKLEAELLSGIHIETMEDLERAADKLTELGVHRMFISLGAEGVYAVMGDQKCHLHNIPGNMVNTTGCGDAFMAAIAWAYLEGMDLEDTARAGLAAGSIAMESGETINPMMSAEALKERMRG
jgi:pseudouridine kinase